MANSLFLKYGGFAKFSRVALTIYDKIRDSDQIGEFFDGIDMSRLAVAGLPNPNPDHAVANCAIRFVRYLDRHNRSSTTQWNARVGIATGSVVEPDVGVRKHVYDIFGHVANLTGLGQHEVCGMGEMRLVELSSVIERERDRTPRFT